ncbi:hypothetical protein [Mycoplasma zalophi]|uniref:Uncharacterized protein n=1 Tax=Mycoplasma zalophi TaxID=191287 RepID=A0ABS6DPL4_9MOLU|nr:hypothetical protein [Mycoplasma zalophi]MBU4691076.1 hypothetical protein [Mycoplasma zalophi]MBU4692144.1 hypothetical protein [Mycoplasma zalophi]
MKKTTLKKLFIGFLIVTIILLLITIIIVPILFFGLKSESFGLALSIGSILQIVCITTGTMGFVTLIFTIIFAILYSKTKNKNY